jgi:hypothetical protein
MISSTGWAETTRTKANDARRIAQLIIYVKRHQSKLNNVKVKELHDVLSFCKTHWAGMLLSGQDELNTYLSVSNARQWQVVYFGRDTP